MKAFLRILILCVFCTLLPSFVSYADTAAIAETDTVISYVGLSARTRGDYVGLRSVYSVDNRLVKTLTDAGHRVTYGALMGVGDENGEAVLTHADMTVAVVGDRVVAYGKGTENYRCRAVVVYDSENGYGASGVYVSEAADVSLFAYTTLYTHQSETLEKMKNTALLYRAFLIVDGSVTYVDAIGDTFDTAVSLYALSSYFASHEPSVGEADYRMHPSIRRVLSLCMSSEATLGNGVDAIDPSVSHTLSDMRSGIYTVFADGALSVTVNGVTMTGNDGCLSVCLSEGDNILTLASDDAVTQVFFYLATELPVEDTLVLSSDALTLSFDGSYRLYAVYTAGDDEALSVTVGDETQTLSLYTGGGYTSTEAFTLPAGTVQTSISQTDATALVYLVRVSHTVSLSGEDGDLLSVQKVYNGDSAVLPTMYFDDLLYFDGSLEGVTEERTLCGFFGSQFAYRIDGDTATLTAYTGSHDRLILPGTLDGYRVTAVTADALSAATECSYLYIPDSILTLESGALAACTSLAEIAVEESNTAFAAKDGNLYTKDMKMLVRLAVGVSRTMITVESGVTAIGDYAFSGATSKSVLLPTSVTSIGKGAFSGMKKLVAVYYEGSASLWNGVSVASENGNINTSTLYYYSASKPASGDENNYWYYGQNGNVTIYQNSSWTPPVA